MIGSLFSGIGGLELGLERAGLGPVVWQVEQDDFCRRVLAKHWPDVDRSITDVRAATASVLKPVDIICGGFPCQDVSSAGKRAGLEGERSGLWREYRRIVDELRPTWVVVENVASGASRWLCPVRSDLHELGYRTRALGIAASDCGAPHRRARIFVLASNTDSKSKLALAVDAEVACASVAADADSDELRIESRRRCGTNWRGEAVASADRWCEPQPSMVRVVHGVPRGLDGRRRRALGNAVVPQCAEIVGHVLRRSAEGSGDG